MIRRIAPSLRRLHRGEGGSAITEFTMFLPVWLICFVGIVNLGKFGHSTTNTQIQAQQNLWENLVDKVDYDLQDAEFISPRVAAIPAAEKSMRPRAKHVRANETANNFESVTWSVAMGVQGHWGESYQRTIILDSAGIADLGDGPHYQASDLIEAAYPTTIVSDALSDSDMPSGGVADIVASAIQASGALSAIGAGIRYGVVVGEKTDDTFSISGFGEVTSVSRYDALVPPAAMTGFTADRIPFFLARLMAESEDNYAVMLNYTESEWTNESPGDFDFDTDIGQDDAEDQVEQQCRQAGFGSNTSRCRSCRDRGYNTKSACDCADDPDCPAPPP